MWNRWKLLAELFEHIWKTKWLLRGGCFCQLDFQRKLLQNVYWEFCIFKDKITEKFKLTEHYLFEEIYNTSDKLNVKIKWTFHFWREFSNCELAQIFTKCVSPPYTSLSSSTKISQNGANWNSSEWHRMKSCSIRTFSVKLHHIVNCNFQSIYIWKKNMFSFEFRNLLN